MILRYAVLAALVAATTACAETGGETLPADEVPAAGVAGGELIDGTPAGGLEEWVGDIRSGLEDVPRLAVSDLPSAQRRVLDLYVGRQEYIELYWGAAGRLRPVGEVALEREILEAETTFHDLLTLLSEPSVEEPSVSALVSVLNTKLERVVSEAKRAGVDLVPIGNTAASGGKE